MKKTANNRGCAVAPEVSKTESYCCMYEQQCFLALAICFGPVVQFTF